MKDIKQTVLTFETDEEYEDFMKWVFEPEETEEIKRAKGLLKEFLIENKKD